jgi:hypothetical protein
MANNSVVIPEMLMGRSGKQRSSTCVVRSSVSVVVIARLQSS